MKKTITQLLLALLFTGPAFVETALADTIIMDTNRMVYTRGDMVYHVANNPSAPALTRYRFGSHQDYSEVGMWYEFPTSSNGTNVVSQVELLGFEVVFIVNTQNGGSPDDIAYHVYDADAAGAPDGTALASGTFVSDGSLNTGNGSVGIKTYMFNNGDGVEVTDPNGFFIGIVTNDPANDDIVILANNFCLNVPEPDGRGEKRFKVKLNSDDSWEALQDRPGNGNLDCDGFIYPILRITETYATGFLEVKEQGGLLSVAPNPIEQGLANLSWEGFDGDQLQVTATDVLGRNFSLGLVSNVQGNSMVSLEGIPSGTYWITLNDGVKSETMPVVIQ